MKTQTLFTLALAAGLALTGCGAGDEAPQPLTQEEKDEAFDTVLIEEGFSPEMLKEGRKLAHALCNHADSVGAVTAIEDAYYTSLPYGQEIQKVAAQTIGAGLRVYCPEHLWALEELAQ